MKKQNNQVWWKVIIVLTFILSLVSASILIYNKLPKYEYYTKIITLENENTIKYFDGKIVDYLCDEGVITNVHKSNGYFYASTWEGTKEVKPKYKGMTGSCIIRVRMRR